MALPSAALGEQILPPPCRSRVPFSKACGPLHVIPHLQTRMDGNHASLKGLLREQRLLEVVAWCPARSAYQ